MENQTIRTLLVDDEAVLRQGIRDLLEQYPDFTVVGEADSRDTALSLLAEQRVDLIFMDIQMPGGSGFELAEQVHRDYPEVLFIFLTGHAGFALEGYEYAPLDFLVKPVVQERFTQAAARVVERIGQRRDAEPRNRLSIRTTGGFQLFDAENIAYLERTNRKVWIVRKDGERIESGETIQEMEEIFHKCGFFRSHQSYLVPLVDICSIRKDTFGQSYWLLMRGGEELPLSRRKYYELRERLEKMGTMLG